MRQPPPTLDDVAQRRQTSARIGSGLGGLAASVGLGLCGCATAGPYNPEHLAPTDHAEVASLCTSTIGLRPGVEQYDACLEALSASVRGVALGQALAASQADCLRQGLPPGGRALAQCELDRSRARAAGPQTMPVLSSGPTPPAVRVRSYWSASNAEVHRREETACAQLGLEPVGGAFAQCVASLDASLFAANNPSQ